MDGGMKVFNTALQIKTKIGNKKIIIVIFKMFKNSILVDGSEKVTNIVFKCLWVKQIWITLCFEHGFEEIVLKTKSI